MSGTSSLPPANPSPELVYSRILRGRKNVGTRDGYDSVSREQDGLDADKDREEEQPYESESESSLDSAYKAKKTTAGHARTTKNRSKPKDHREYTPDAMETETSIDDHEVKLGYPDWSQISHYQPVFDSLERVPILNRHPSLPILYKYTGEQQHPQRHLYDLPAPTETYIYLFDPSLEGCRLASKFASVHDVPRGPTSTMTSLGLFNAQAGSWVFARNIEKGGDPMADVLQCYVPQKGRVTVDTKSDLNKARDEALGPRFNRSDKIGSLPVEQYQDGSHINPVGSSERCYPLGITYEKQTIYSAPNANSKLRNGDIDTNTKIRVNLLKNATKAFLQGFEEAPQGLRQCMAEMSDMVAMPHVGHPDNKYCPSVQLNIARPQLHHSRNGLEEQGHFGGKHRDRGDSICGFSGMVSISDIPDGFDAGRFHLLSLGLYFVLDQVDVIYFTGQLVHAGTPPLAPEDAENIEPWAYRCVMIFYPASRVLTGSTQTYLAASGVRGEPVTLPREVFSYDPPRPYSNHANFFTDGGVYTTPEDHFTTAMRMFILYGHHLFRQLPYVINFDSQQVTNAISAMINDQPFFAPPWKHAPAVTINQEHKQLLCETSVQGDYIEYPPSSQFPSRQSVVHNFVNNYFLPSAKAIPQMGMNGIFNEVPVHLRPPRPDEELNILRPRNTNKDSDDVRAIRQGIIPTQKEKKRVGRSRGNMLIMCNKKHIEYLNIQTQDAQQHQRREATIQEVVMGNSALEIDPTPQQKRAINTDHIANKRRRLETDNSGEFRSADNLDAVDDELYQLAVADIPRRNICPNFSDEEDELDEDEEYPIDEQDELDQEEYGEDKRNKGGNIDEEGQYYDEFDEDRTDDHREQILILRPTDRDIHPDNVAKQNQLSLQERHLYELINTDTITEEQNMIDSALVNVASVLRQYADVLQSLDDLDANITRGLHTENIITSIPGYVKAMKLLVGRADMNTAVQSITHHRILNAEAEIYSLVLTSCLPTARRILRGHQTHPLHNTTLIPCHCYHDVHPHDKWLVRLTLKLQDMLFLRPDGFQIVSLPYLSRLSPVSTYTFKPSKFNVHYHASGVPIQNTLNVLKDVLYTWLDIPKSREAEYSCILVDMLQKHLGAVVLYLPGVRKMCYDVPPWVYTNLTESQGTHFQEEPLRAFDSAVKRLRTKMLVSPEGNQLSKLWSSYIKFITNIRSGPRGVPVAIQEYNNPVLSPLHFQRFTEFLRHSLLFVGGKLPPSDKFYNLLNDQPDFFLPLREFAPSRHNFVSQTKGHARYLQTPLGLFNLLVFRILCFNTPAARQESFTFTLQTLKDFRWRHRKDQSYYFNSHSYGSPCDGWEKESLMERYWLTANHTWPAWIKEKETNDDLNSFSKFVDWLDNSKDPSDGVRDFFMVGDLTGMLIAGDLAYAGVIDKPTVEEMGKLIAKVSKGAIAGLVYLRLLRSSPKTIFIQNIR
ncbi:hypothetical protein QCA50_019442 [Cerrena zonata]|uniref:Uncharacterized protein n=1 Tax=Cerrena zonata TaxID=2478898 RepID=A0AAW0FBB6_9APHY